MSDEIAVDSEKLVEGINSESLSDNQLAVAETDSYNPPNTVKEAITVIERHILNATEKEQAYILANRVMYAKDVEALALMNTLLSSVVLASAEELGVQINLHNFSPDTGESLSYKQKVEKTGVYTFERMSQIAIITKIAMTRKAREAQYALDEKKKFENENEELKRQIADNLKTIRQLQVEIKHPTILTDSIVLAYMNDKGNFIYYGEKDGHEAKVKDFASAIKFRSAIDALIKLKLLLKNFDHPITKAYQMQVYNASMIVVPSSDASLPTLRETSEKYETEHLSKAKAPELKLVSDNTPKKKKKKKFTFKMK